MERGKGAILRKVKGTQISFKGFYRVREDESLRLSRKD